MSSSTGATVTLRGRVATDPVAKVTSTGKEVTRFRVVSTRRYKDGDDVWTDGDEFGVWVAVWNGLGASALQHLRKGDGVVVEGGISTRPYDGKDGNPGWMTEVRASLIGLDLQWLRARIDRSRIVEKDRPVVEDSTGEAEPEPDPADDVPPWDIEAVAAG